MDNTVAVVIGIVQEKDNNKSNSTTKHILRVVCKETISCETYRYYKTLACVLLNTFQTNCNKCCHQCLQFYHRQTQYAKGLVHYLSFRCNNNDYVYFL